jgi:SdrD B-like domain
VMLLNGSGAALFRQADGSVSTTASATPLTVTTTTQAGEPGRYQFSQLPPGDYQVKFTLPGAGYQWTASDVIASPSNDSLDSDAIAASPTAATATTATITLTAPVTDLATPANPLVLTNPTIDAGIKPVYSVGNRVWLDANNNGIVDGTEPGIDGVMVELWAADANGNPTGAAALASDTTQSGGYYLFTGRSPGNYVVVVMPPAPVNGVAYVSSTGANGKTTGPYEQGSDDYSATGTNKDHGTLLTAPNGLVPAGKVISRVIALGPNQASGEDGNATPGRPDTTPDNQSNLTVDFGLFLPASLGNLTFIDTNANGKFDGADIGVNGITVVLLDASGNVVASTVSKDRPAGDTRGIAGPGWYYFDNLTPGNYSVRFLPPSNLGFTVPGATATVSGSPPEANNSQPLDATGITKVVTLVAGDNNPQLDAGFVPAAIPTLNQWMLMLLALLLLGSMSLVRRRV